MENPSRRRVLTAGLAGAAATTLFGSRAAATTPEPPAEDPAGAPAATEASVPQRPTDADTELLAFAQGAELAARDLYRIALEARDAETPSTTEAAATTEAPTTSEGTGTTAATAPVVPEDGPLQAAHDNHQAAADALSALIGGAAPQRASADLVEAQRAAFETADLAAVAEAAYELENTLVATHTELLGQLEGVDGAKRIAAVLIAEAAMAAVMAHVAGNGDDLAAVIDNSAAALTPPEG